MFVSSAFAPLRRDQRTAGIAVAILRAFFQAPNQPSARREINSRCRLPTAKLPSMQKPNYQFEKRRKELEKKAKKDEKRQLKLAASQSAAGNNAASSDPVKPA